MPRSWIIAALALAGLGTTVGMVVLGWPEANPAQVVLLELAALPAQVSFALGLWHLHGLGTRPSNHGTRVLGILAGVSGLGLLLVLMAYLTGPRGLVHFGQSVVWLALLAGMFVIVRRLPRPRFTQTTFIADERPATAGAADRPLFDGE
ncbi:MAG: hypothetical protein WCF12_15990 [Propionicimonas sp.]